MSDARRKKPKPQTCSSCGMPGHLASRRGGCSHTFLAAQAVLAGNATITQAAARWGVAKQSISHRLIADGHRIRAPKEQT